MDYKDTVIKLNRGGILSDIEVDNYNNGAEAQAEISFKAGRESTIDDTAEMYIVGIDRGRKEVVEYVNKYLNPQIWSRDTKEPYYTIKKSEWQAKLKEWEEDGQSKLP